MQQTCPKQSPPANRQHLHCASGDNIHQRCTKIIYRLYLIYIHLSQPPPCPTSPRLPRRPSRCSTSKTHSDETRRDCYLPSPLYENQIGNCFCPWFTSMQTKKLFSYFHVNVFFMGGDKCNQSSSRQGRRALPPRGRGLLVLSSPGIIKQGNWKWYLIDTAISTGGAGAPVPTPPSSPPLYRLPDSRLPQVKRGEGMNKFPLRPGRRQSPREQPVNLEAQCCEDTHEGGKFYVRGWRGKYILKCHLISVAHCPLLKWNTLSPVYPAVSIRQVLLSAAHSPAVTKNAEFSDHRFGFRVF